MSTNFIGYRLNLPHHSPLPPRHSSFSAPSLVPQCLFAFSTVALASLDDQGHARDKSCGHPPLGLSLSLSFSCAFTPGCTGLLGTLQDTDPGSAVEVEHVCCSGLSAMPGVGMPRPSNHVLRLPPQCPKVSMAVGVV